MEKMFGGPQTPLNRGSKKVNTGGIKGILVSQWKVQR